MSLSLLHANILSATASSIYVASLYLAQPKSRNGSPVSRDDPLVIKRRVLGVSLGTVFNCWLVYFVVRAVSPEDSECDYIWKTLQYLGLSVESISLLPHLVVPLLFLGPLYATYLSVSTFPQQYNLSLPAFLNKLKDLQVLRNFIASPITEEATYRACVLTFLHLGGVSKKALVFAAPCWFGLAHLHHSYDIYHRNGRTAGALRTAVMTVAFQFTYTTVFGWLASTLFLRTGSLLVPITAHVFCNIMGVPQLSWELQVFPKCKTSILLAYVLGVLGFSFTLWPWTKTPGSLYWS